MKKLISLLLALLMLLSLAACGGKEGPADDDYVEETAPSNSLDPSSPIPADTGTLTLTAQTFEDANLILNLPAGVSVREEERTENFAHIYVTDDAGEWVLRFEPFMQGTNTLINVDSTVIYDGNPIKTDWSRDVSATLAGFDARVWANNIRKGWLNPSNEQDAPAVDIILDYGETLVGPWYGMYIRLEAQEPTEDTNIYDLLYLRAVRAVLNNFEVIATPDGVTRSSGGITATFPARWEVLVGENGFVTSFHSAALTGGINFGTTYGSDPAELASLWEGEHFTKTMGGKEYQCVIVATESDGDSSTTYALRMYSDFSDTRSLSIYARLRGYTGEDYKAYLDDEVFAGVMNSIQIDPNGYHEPGTASVDGFSTKRGQIDSYTGTATELEIPAVIGEFDTEVIGADVFKGNTAITSVVIPEGVTVIQPSAFEGCANLERVTFPATLMEIDANAFRDCPKLTDVVLPSTVAYVGPHAFDGSGAGSFTGSGAFYDFSCFDSSTFDSIAIGDGADISGDSMFSASTITSVSLPEDLTALGRGAFSNCRNLHSIDLPDTLRTLGESCFLNMGYLQVTLPEGLEEIPDNCFNSTNLDVLVIPESVTRIGDYATFGGACIVIQNPNVEIGVNAIQADYMFLQDAKDYVFPSDHVAMWGSRLYLDGIYDPKDIQGDLYNGTSISSQIYLPSDATEAESDAMDAYLASIGYQEISWIGSAKDFMPESTFDYDTEGYNITGYHGESKVLTIPDYVFYEDDGWYLTKNVYGVADGAFRNSDFTAAYFRGNCGNGTGSRILEGSAALADIWFTTQLLFDMDADHYVSDTFAGIPDDVTVHLPASMTDDQRAQAEDFLHSIGVPDTAAFDYYSLG
ncbi:MAG: leucine-rich repeat domain-containing protein [Oscillospiraceae bacterium]|nr:leucine-rich repeat domain-containing protein [Oscillospiraceae bacterium]